MEALSLIDVSGDDDLLLDLSTPPPAPAPPRHPDPTHGGSLVAAEAASYLAPAAGSPAAASRAADAEGVMEEQAPPERTESPQQLKVKKGVNLRKSLAWDSAFFTSEGVLDTEELAIVNSTFRKTQGSRLPGIVEEMRKSGDSTTSTLESETWAVESLETELFDNVRASIQRSLGKPNKVPGGPAGSSKPPKATTNVPRIAARKEVDRMPQTKIRDPVSTSQGVFGGKQRPQVNSKESAASKVKLPGAIEAKASAKPPRALPRVAMMRSSSTNTAITSATLEKRSSTGGVVNRPAIGKTANTSASMRSGGGTKPSSVSKSGALTSANSSSRGVSVDARPDAKGKSTLSNQNRTAQRVPVRSSKPGTSRTIPAKVPARSGSKIPTRGHVDRASPSISPSSSVDSMSSVMSGASTASTIGKMSHTSESLNILSPSLRKSNDCPPTPKLRPPTITEGHSACGDNSNATADVSNQGKGFKPTGLRRPTPKIGYFDAEKSIEQNMCAQLQQPMKIQCQLPATPKSQPSTQNMKAAASNIGKQENEPFKSEAVKTLPLKVSQMEADPLVAELEACTLQMDPVVAQPETDKSIDQSVDAQMQPLSIKISACKSKATKAVPLKAVQVELDPLDVAEPEACSLQIDPVVAQPEADKSIDQSVDAQMQPQSIKISACKSKATKAVPLKAVQVEVDPRSVAEPEACLQPTDLVVAADTPKENIPVVHQNIQANVNTSSLVDLLTQKLSSISLGEATPDLAS